MALLSALNSVLDEIDAFKQLKNKLNSSENKIRFMMKIWFILVVLLVGTGIYFYNNYNKVIVYDVTGENLETAIRMLEEKGGFNVTKKYDYSNSIEIGHVISQYPTGNSFAKKGSNVVILISEGKKDIRITLDPQGGFLEDNILMRPYFSTYQTLPTPTRKHYSFDGWYTDPIDGIMIVKNSIVSNTDNHTLYAHWSKNPHSDWDEALPDYVTENPDLYDIASKTQYRSYKIELVSSAKPILTGLAFVRRDATKFSEWSDWQNEPIEESQANEVETREIAAKMGIVYHYERWYGIINNNIYRSSYCGDSWPDYDELLSAEKLPEGGFFEGHMCYIGPERNIGNSNWWNEDVREEEIEPAYTQYRCRIVEEAIYYYEKPAEYSLWQDEFVAGNDEIAVETRQLFQYIKK